MATNEWDTRAPWIRMGGVPVDYPEPRTLSEQALSQLREAIMSGELAPGARLPLREQVERLSMSNLPVREALNRLEQVGLVDQIPHKGARVAEISIRDMEDTYSLRMMLESRAIRLAAEFFDDDDAERGRTWLLRYQEYSNLADRRLARQAHFGFHFDLYTVSRSRWLTRLIPMLWDNSERYLRLTIDERGDVLHRVAEHEQLLDACIANDPGEAERILIDHLSTTVQLVRQRLASDPDAVR